MDKNEVYNIAKSLYGEDRVGTKGAYVVIHFPEVIISNNKGVHHTLRDIFVRVKPSTATFEVARTTFTDLEVLVGYTHSHITRGTIPSKYGQPCLGRGPIRGTMTELISNPTHEKWITYFLELDQFLQTESLTGGPYIRLSELNNPVENAKNPNITGTLAPVNTTSIENEAARKTALEIIRSKDYQYLIDSRSSKVFNFDLYIHDNYLDKIAPIYNKYLIKELEAHFGDNKVGMLEYYNAHIANNMVEVGLNKRTYCYKIANNRYTQDFLGNSIRFKNNTFNVKVINTTTRNVPKAPSCYIVSLILQYINRLLKNIAFDYGKERNEIIL